MRPVPATSRHNASWDFLLLRNGKTAYMPLCGELSNPLSAELWRYDTATLEAERVLRLDRVFAVSPREIPPSKIHTSLTEMPDGRILMTTHTTARSPAHPYWLFESYYDHNFEGFAGSHVLIYDPRTGHVENLGVPVKRDSIYGAWYDAPHDALFFTTFLRGRLFRMDMKTLAVRDLGQTTEFGSYCIFGDRRGGVITSTRTGHVLRIDTETLAIRDLGAVATAPETGVEWDTHRVIAHYAFAPDGAVWFSLHMSNKYYRIDPATHALSFVDLSPRGRWRGTPPYLPKGHVFDSRGMMWYLEARESKTARLGGALHLFRCDVLHGGEPEYMGLVGVPDHAAAMVSEIALDADDVLHFVEGNHGADMPWMGRVDLRKVDALRGEKRIVCRDAWAWNPFPGAETAYPGGNLAAAAASHRRFKEYCVAHEAFVAGPGRTSVVSEGRTLGRFWEKMPFEDDHTVRCARFLADGRVEFRCGAAGEWRFLLARDGSSVGERTAAALPEAPAVPAGLAAARLPSRAGRRFLAKAEAAARMGDGRWIVGTADSLFALWNPATGAVTSLGGVGAQGPVRALAVSGDGKVAYGICGDDEDLMHLVRYDAARGLEDLGHVCISGDGIVVASCPELSCVAVNGDGSEVAVGGAGRLACGFWFRFGKDGSR